MSARRRCAGPFRASAISTSSNGSSGWARCCARLRLASPSSRTTSSSDGAPARLVVVRSPPRSLHTLLYRDVGAVQLLRDAGLPVPVHGQGARLHRYARGRGVRQLRQQCVVGRDRRWLRRRSLAGAISQRAHRWGDHRARPFHARVPRLAILPRRRLAGPARPAAPLASPKQAIGSRLLGLVIRLWQWLRSFTREEWKRISAVLVFFVFASLFWGAYEQAGSTLTLFADRYVHLELIGIKLYASWFVSIQGAFVILLSPIFAWLWVKLGPRQPSAPAKFALALMFVGLAFVLLMPAGAAAQGGVKVSPLWLVGAYFIEELGEVCLYPVGLSVVTKLAPARIVGLMMGVFFLSNALGNKLAGWSAGFISTTPLPTLFGATAAVTLGAALVMFLLLRPVRNLMGGVR